MLEKLKNRNSQSNSRAKFSHDDGEMETRPLPIPPQNKFKVEDLSSKFDSISEIEKKNSNPFLENYKKFEREYESVEESYRSGKLPQSKKKKMQQGTGNLEELARGITFRSSVEKKGKT